MSSRSGTTSPSMTNSSTESSSWRATSEDSSDRSDNRRPRLIQSTLVSSSKNSSPIKPSATKTVSAKKQKVSEKTAKVTVTDKDGNASDEDTGHERKLNSPKATIVQKNPVLKTATVAKVESDGGEAEERLTKKLVATSNSKSKTSTIKKPAAKAKKNAEVPDNVTLTVSDTKDAESTAKPAPASKPRKRPADVPTNDGAHKRARLPPNAYQPDSYESLNKEDKLLFDLKTRSLDATWKDLVQEFNLKLQIHPKVNLDALRKRWPRVKAAATEIAHSDIQKMCVYKQDMEVQLEATREELLAKFERDKEAMLRKFKADMWSEIAKYVAQDGGNQYEPATLQRKYGTGTDQDEKERNAKERSKTLTEKNDADASEGDDEGSDVEEPKVVEKAEDDDDDEEDTVDTKGEDEHMSHGEDQAKEDVWSRSMGNDSEIEIQENDVHDYGQH